MFGDDSVFGSHTDEHILHPFFDSATEARQQTRIKQEINEMKKQIKQYSR